MPRHAGPYQLIERHDTGGKPVYYVRFRNEAGELLPWQSSGQSSKTAARAWAAQKTKSGRIPTKQTLTFKRYAEGWWTPEHEYVRGRLARGASLSPAYLDVKRIYLAKHILPTFGNKKIAAITPRMVEDWLLGLIENPTESGEPLSPSTANHCLTTLKTMLTEAARMGTIASNPAAFVRQLHETPKERTILTVGELKELFREDRLEETWGDERHFTINLLAASTGMRMGECQALQVQHVHPDYVAVVHSWARKHGLKDPKWNSAREIPIPAKTSRYLGRVIGSSSFNEPEDLVFCGRDRHTPIGHKEILQATYHALENIGISADERTRRNVTFHSWRHLFNSLCRGIVPDYKTRKLTGHRTARMTEHYTHLNLDDFRDVAALQEEVFS